MVTPSEPEVQTVSISGDSLKVTLEELSGVSDWSTLEVALGEPSVASWTRRTNTLYFKGIAEGETQVTINFEGTERKSFKLTVTA